MDITKEKRFYATVLLTFADQILNAGSKVFKFIHFGICFRRFRFITSYDTYCLTEDIKII